MDKVIRIECEGADTVDYENLIETQGNLKTLSKVNYEKLKFSLLEHGFSEPILIWKDKNKIVNGHQRLRTVKTLVEKEGYAVEPLPVSYVYAEDEQELARKLLPMASSFGEGDDEGLYEFMVEHGIDVEELAKVADISGINLPKFTESYFSDDMDTDLDNVEPTLDNPEEPLPEDIPTNQVRMVQLFFSEDVNAEFKTMITDLKKHYKVENISDCVLAMTKETHDQHCKD